MTGLVLYYTNTCPYCQKVFRFMQQHNIRIALKDTLQNPNNQQELLKIGGKAQVPCLVIDGKALYESDDIIQWLNDNMAKGKKAR